MASRAQFSCPAFGPRYLSHPSISWPIDRIFRIDFVISWRPEIPAFLTAFPRAAMPILIVGIAQAKAFVLHLATPATSKRYKRRIATNPLLTTRRLAPTAPWHRHRSGNARRRSAWPPCGCKSSHRLLRGDVVIELTRFRGASHRRSLYPLRSCFIPTPNAPYRLRPRGLTSARDESTFQSQTQSTINGNTKPSSAATTIATSANRSLASTAERNQATQSPQRDPGAPASA